MWWTLLYKYHVIQFYESLKLADLNTPENLALDIKITTKCWKVLLCFSKASVLSQILNVSYTYLDLPPKNDQESTIHVGKYHQSHGCFDSKVNS